MFRRLVSHRLQRLVLHGGLVLSVMTPTPSVAQTIQTYNIDSLKRVLANPLPDTARIWALNNLARNIVNSDTTVALCDQAIQLSRRIGFVRGEAEAFNNLAYWYNQKGNYPDALQSYLKAIVLAESANFTQSLERSYNSIASVYFYRRDFTTAVEYSRKARTLSRKLGDLEIQTFSASWLSRAYLGLEKPDSALKYAQESYEVAKRLQKPFPLYMATTALGQVHLADGSTPVALEFLRLSLRHSKIDGRFFRISAANQLLAETFRLTGMKDSSIWYARQAFIISKEHDLQATLMSSSLILSELTENRDKAESLKYLRIAMAAKDSLFSQEKNSQIESLNVNEMFRQREVEAMRKQAEIARRNNLQYAAIGFGLVLFVITFLVVSRTVRASTRLVRFLGVLAMLMVFEFVNLLLAPGISEAANNTPLYMLILMIVVAACLIPIHQYLDKKVIERLVEKNKTLRESSADEDTSVATE